MNTVPRPNIQIHHYPGYPFKSAERRLVGPYTILDYGDAKHIWRHGWRRLDEDGMEAVDEARNVCRRLRAAGRLPK